MRGATICIISTDLKKATNRFQQKIKGTVNVPFTTGFIGAAPCCGARHIPCRRCGCVICRPLPLARLPLPATGGGRLAPRTLTSGSIPSSIKNKQMPHWGICLFGAANRTRTGTSVTSRDFKSLVSTYSTTAAHDCRVIIAQIFPAVKGTLSQIFIIKWRCPFSALFIYLKTFYRLKI